MRYLTASKRLWYYLHLHMARPEQRLPSPSPLDSGDFIQGRTAGTVRGGVNFVIGMIGLYAGERAAAGDVKSSVVFAAIDGGIIVADALATVYIARRHRKIALQQQATIEAQTNEINSLRRGNGHSSSS